MATRPFTSDRAESDLPSSATLCRWALEELKLCEICLADPRYEAALAHALPALVYAPLALIQRLPPHPQASGD